MIAVRRLLPIALLIAPLTFSLGACESMEKLNPFAEKETPLPGDRRPVFPEGVPGVDFGAPPSQPQNSNIPIVSSVDPGNPDRPVQAQGQPAQPVPGQQPGAQRPAAQGGDPDDAWSGAR